MSRVARAFAWLKSEPVATLTGVVSATTVVLTTVFGVQVNPGAVAAIDGLVVALMAAVARAAVVPSSKIAQVTPRIVRFSTPAGTSPVAKAKDGRRLGHISSPRDDRDFRYQAKTSIPAAVHNAVGLIFTMLRNNELGDCAPAGWEHMLQVLHAALGLPPVDPTDAETVALYSAVTGYNPADPSSDRGTVLRALLKYLLAKKVISSFEAVPTDTASLRSAIYTHKAVLAGFALPTGAEAEGVTWRVPRTGKAAGSWGGHCVPLVGYSREEFDLVSWGELGTATVGFVADYIDEAWVVELAAA